MTMSHRGCQADVLACNVRFDNCQCMYKFPIIMQELLTYPLLADLNKHLYYYRAQVHMSDDPFNIVDSLGLVLQYTYYRLTTTEQSSFHEINLRLPTKAQHQNLWKPRKGGTTSPIANKNARSDYQAQRLLALLPLCIFFRIDVKHRRRY